GRAVPLRSQATPIPGASERAGFAERGDFLPGVAHLEQDFLGVLAELGGDAPGVGGRVAETDGRADDRDLPAVGIGIGAQVPVLPDLRVAGDLRVVTYGCEAQTRVAEDRAPLR